MRNRDISADFAGKRTRPKGLKGRVVAPAHNRSFSSAFSFIIEVHVIGMMRGNWKLAAASVSVLVFLSRLPTVVSSDRFVYSNNAECSIPFTEVSVATVDCQGNHRSQQQYQDAQTSEGCYFGDEMMLWGTFVLDQKVNRYFSVLFDVCYYGSRDFYKPLRCKTHRRTIDMRDYALMEQEGDQQDEDYKEGFTYESYWQDEQRQQWIDERAQARAYQAEVEQTYLYPGSYSFNIALSVPQKSFPFWNESQLRVRMTMLPRESYTLDYYRAPSSYTTNIEDSKYQTECYLSFDAIPEYGYNRLYNYFSMAGLGCLLLGVATLVSSKRRVICASGDDQPAFDDLDVVEAWYESHVEQHADESSSHLHTGNVLGTSSLDIDD